MNEQIVDGFYSIDLIILISLRLFFFKIYLLLLIERMNKMVKKEFFSLWSIVCMSVYVSMIVDVDNNNNYNEYLNICTNKI